jgi:hypothetical protein
LRSFSSGTEQEPGRRSEPAQPRHRPAAEDPRCDTLTAREHLSSDPVRAARRYADGRGVVPAARVAAKHGRSWAGTPSVRCDPRLRSLAARAGRVLRGRGLLLPFKHIKSAKLPFNLETATVQFISTNYTTEVQHLSYVTPPETGRISGRINYYNRQDVLSL